MLSRFARYIEKGWDFPALVRHVRDHRPAAQIPASSIFLTTFGLFATRLPSFNAMELELKMPARWDPWVGAAKPSADTLSYSLARFDLECLRDNLARMAHRAKRKKTLRRIHKNSLNPYIVAALDGHELWSSFNRSCDQCLKRDIEINGKKVTQFYHRVVTLQLVGMTPSLTLDIEPILPGEDEVAAATRIVRRIRQRYPRFLDVLTVDALYLRAPFTTALLEEGFEVVTVLKQENRDLYRDVEGLLKITRPSAPVTDQDRTSQSWDLEDLTSWPQVGRPVRVVCSREQTTRRIRVDRKWKEETVMADWWWMTTLKSSQAGADWVGEMGHDRWDIENRGFNELSQHWAMNHCFHHHPTAILAIQLILAMAFALTTFFFDRNLKPAFRKDKTRLFLASLLMDDLIRSSCSSFWSHPP